MSKSNGKELILGTAAGYRFEHIKPFLFTLQNSGYKGDLCLFVSKIDYKTITKLHKHGVKLIPFQEKYPFTKRLKIPSDLLPNYLFDSRTISTKYLRYLLYYLYLKENREKYSKILITDVRDIIFQRNPFDFDFNYGLCCFIEDTHITIEDSPFNSVRIKRHFGETALEKIGKNYPLCSGTTYEAISNMIDYLKQMIDLLPEIDTTGGGDQGLHNYVVYVGGFDNLKIFDDQHGPVFTFGTKTIKSIYINKRGSVTNNKGIVFNIIHQYDRHPELFNKLSIHYKVKMPLKLPLTLYKFVLSWKNRIENLRGWDFVNHLLFKYANKFGVSIIMDRWKIL